MPSAPDRAGDNKERGTKRATASVSHGGPPPAQPDFEGAPNVPSSGDVNKEPRQRDFDNGEGRELQTKLRGQTSE